MQVILFSLIAQALSSPLFGKSLTTFAPIRRADSGERARHCRPGWERVLAGNDEFTLKRVTTRRVAACAARIACAMSVSAFAVALASGKTAAYHRRRAFSHDTIAASTRRVLR